MPRFQLISVLLTLNSGEMISDHGSNQDEDACVVCENEVPRLLLGEQPEPGTVKHDKQRRSNTFFDENGMFTASMGPVA